MPSWMEEALARAQKAQQNPAPIEDGPFDPTRPDQREKLTREFRMTYEQASEREIEKAIDLALEKVESPYERKEFLRFLRSRLED